MKMLCIPSYSAGGANFELSAFWFFELLYCSKIHRMYVYVPIACCSAVHGLMFMECLLGLGLLCILIYSGCT